MLLRNSSKIAFASLLSFFCFIHFSTAIEPPPGFSSISPVIDFIYPQFNEEGQKIWDLAGAEGFLVSHDNSLRVNKMIITTFSYKNGESFPDTILESDSALIFTKQHRAESSEAVKVQGDGFHIKGKGWICDRTNNQIIVKENVQVFFQDSLQEILSAKEKTL